MEHISTVVQVEEVPDVKSQTEESLVQESLDLFRSCFEQFRGRDTSAALTQMNKTRPTSIRK